MNEVKADACTNENCGVLIEVNYLNTSGERIAQELVNHCPLCGALTRPVYSAEYEEWVADD